MAPGSLKERFIRFWKWWRIGGKPFAWKSTQASIHATLQPPAIVHTDKDFTKLTAVAFWLP